MNIVFVRHSLLNRGGDKMVLAHASRLVERGHRVIIRVNEFSTLFTLPCENTLERISLKGKVGTLIFSLFGRLPGEVVIADIIPMVCFLLPRNRNRIVYFAQDYDESYYDSPLMKLLVRAFYFIGLTVFKVPVIAVSNELGTLLQRRFRARVLTVENGIDSSLFYPDPCADLIASKEGRKALVLLSRGDYRKGFDIARETIEKLAESPIEPFEVWTVGEPASGCFPGIVHRDFGYVDEKRLRRIIGSADLFFYPTRHEGFGLMVLEAFACGCPVVTTKAVPYAVHGVNALVGEVEDSTTLASMTRELLVDRSLAAQLAAEGQRLAQGFSLDESTSKFEAALCEFRGGEE